MTDFLLELRCEEIPARMQAGARADLEKLFRAELTAAGVTPAAITVWSTPRRLALIARDLPLATSAVSEETKGPRTSAPPQALEGFLRKTGLTQDQLQDRDGTWFAVVEKPGRALADVLAEAIPAIVRAFPWPKSMRWGAASLSTESVRWVRPLSGIVAILGDDLVECAVGDVASGYVTLGHRFHAPGPITIGGAGDYQEKLRACHVIVDHVERQDTIRTGAASAAEAAGLRLIADEGLVIENAGLTEWPVPLLGRFDEAFLDVPPEVIQLTARVNQKYFVCEDGAGKLANAFVCTANISADDPAVVVDGNRKVLAARLSDARFFWEQDRKVPLAVQAEKLARITFHEKLGSVADKVERVAKLARWLVEEGIVHESPLPLAGGAGGGPVAATSDIPTPNPTRKREGDLADQAEQAARLCKADLVTDMVGEFPELQGLMGGYYARAEGLPDAVADAIRDHYKPVGQGDDVPTAPVTVAVSLADKLDTLVGFFAIGEKPSGSRDPFALRRSAIGILSLLQTNRLRLNWLDILPQQLEMISFHYGKAIGFKRAGEFAHYVRQADFKANEAMAVIFGFHKETGVVRAEAELHFDRLKSTLEIAPQEIGNFLADRLKVQQREAGVRHDLIDAVFVLGGEDDLVRLLARVHALQAFIGTEDGTNLLAGYKRAANILKKEEWPSAPLPLAGGAGGGAGDGADTPTPNPSREREGDYTPEPAEQALITALDAA